MAHYNYQSPLRQPTLSQQYPAPSISTCTDSRSSEVFSSTHSTTRSSESSSRPSGISFETQHRLSHESKPRLSKDQQDVLEKHFQDHPKPTTQTKKNFSDNLGVPLDKINVGVIWLNGSLAGNLELMLIVVVELVPKSSGESKTRSKEAEQRSTYDVPYKIHADARSTTTARSGYVPTYGHDTAASNVPSCRIATPNACNVCRTTGEWRTICCARTRWEQHVYAGLCRHGALDE